MSDEIKITHGDDTRLGSVTLNGDKVDPWSLELAAGLRLPYTLVWLDGLRCYDTRVIMRYGETEFVIAQTPPSSDAAEAVFAGYEQRRH